MDGPNLLLKLPFATSIPFIEAGYQVVMVTRSYFASGAKGGLELVDLSYHLNGTTQRNNLRCCLKQVFTASKTNWNRQMSLNCNTWCLG